ncbi:MAG: fibrobacter succinogenes major paralogous domain-containing protein [Bacteroidales bacterium]|jgi:uncharacterized protein (TIGR02145 family)|nr:fibrobacter succinogenes major paralogous domain-containing protein [Bacteroidales bacterium]
MIKFYTFKKKSNFLSLNTIFSVFSFLVFTFLVTTEKINAQTQFPHITWEEVKQYPDDLVQMGDDGFLKIHIFMTVDPVNYCAWKRPRITIDLPYGIDFSNAGSTVNGSPVAGSNVPNILVNEPGLTPNTYFNNVAAALSGHALTGSPNFRRLILDYNRLGNTTNLANAELPLGDSIVIKVRIRALIHVNQFNPGIITIKVSSLANQLMTGGDTKTCPLNVIKPVLRVTPTFSANGFLPLDILDTARVSVALDCQNGHARSCSLRYTYNGSIVYIDSVKLDGVPLNILPSNSGVGVNFQNPTSTTSYLHIRLDRSNLGGNITSTPRIITFRVSVNRGCNRTLTPLWQNPLVQQSPSTIFDQWTDNPITLDVPGSTTTSVYHTQATQTTPTQIPGWGNNVVSMRTIPRFNPNDPNDLTVPYDMYAQNQFHSFCYDGKTPNYATLVFNEYPALNDAVTFHFTVQTHNNANLSYCEYIDTSQIYYRVILPSKLNRNVDSVLLVPVTKIKNTDRDLYNRLCIDVQNNYPTSIVANIAHYNSILHNKGRIMTLRLPGLNMSNKLPAGSKVEFQWVYYANPDWINDSYRSQSWFTNTGTQNRHCIYWHSSQYENSCAVPGSYGGAVTTEIIKPHFINPPLPRIAVYSNKTFYWNCNTYTGGTNHILGNNVSTNDPTGPRYAELYVKMPPWLNLDTVNRIDDAFMIRHRDSATFCTWGNNQGPALNSGVYHGADADGYKTYSVKYYTGFGGSTHVVDIRLKPGDCPDEVVIKDTLQVWWDWIAGDRQRNANSLEGDMCRAVFKKTSKVFTELEFICTPPALAIDTFGVFRITRGLKDSNDDHIPDDGTLALDNEIQHWHFLVGDTGYFFFHGFVGGSTSQRWDKLVLVLRFGTGGSIGATQQYKWGTTGHAIPFWNQGTIEIKRWNEDKTDFTLYTLPLTIPTVTNQDSIIVYYDGGANDYVPRGGDSCYIKIPFMSRAGLAQTTMRGNFYVLTYGIKPLDLEQRWVNKFFPDDIFRIVFRNEDIWARSSYFYTYTSPCIPQTITEMHTNTYHAGDEVSNWTREVRYRHKLEKIVFTVPRGYCRTNDKFYLRPAPWHNATIGNAWVPDIHSLVVVPDMAEEDYVTQDSIFTIDMTKYIDYEFDGSQPLTYNFTTHLLSNGKYTPGDDFGGAYGSIKQLYATPASAQSTLRGTFTYKNHLGVPQTRNMTAPTLYYNGRRLALDLQADVMMFNQYAFSNIKIQNSNAGLVNNNNWLFVSGNVENAFLVTQTLPRDTIFGVGKNNCWLKLGTMQGGEVRNYFLVYAYRGKKTCENDTVIVYTVFDGEHIGYMPDIKDGIDSVKNCNRGQKGYTILDLMTARIKIAGFIKDTIPNPIKPGFLHYKSGYAMDYVINGMVSQGALNDASVTFRIPPGQVYIDTIAQFLKASYDYPQGSGFKVLPQAILDTLEDKIGVTSNRSTFREVTIHIKDILEKDVFMLPGFGLTPMNFQDTDRVFTIRIPLLPLCETDLTGSRFRAVFNGKTFCDAPCEDDGTVYISKSFYPDTYPEYDFKVSMKQTSYSRVYSYEQQKDTLLITFQKERGVFVHPIVEETDYVLLRLSENIEVDGNITCPQFGITINLLEPSWINSQGERFYKLYLPAKELNDLLDEVPPRDSLTFEYRIPIKMNPDLTNFDCSSPKQELECQVISMSNFGVPTTDCLDEPFSVGSGTFSVVTLDYDPDQFQVCLNMQNNLSLTCSSLTPIWYRDSAGTGGLLKVGNPFVYSPTQYKDTSFYLRIFYDYNGPMEENIGLTYIKVKMFPRVTSLFSFDSSCVGQETQMKNHSTIGDDPSDNTNTKQWYWYLNGATVPFSTEREPKRVLNSGDKVKLLVVSNDGCEDFSELTAAPHPLPLPTITGNNNICYYECFVYKTEPGMSDYEWTVTNGTPMTPLTGRDSIVVCWNQLPSPIFGYLGVVYTNSNGCRALPKNDNHRIVIRSHPEIPEISGTAQPCQFSTYTYTFVLQDNIVEFYWTVSGATIVAGGNGFNYITVVWNDAGAQELTLDIANMAGCKPTSIGVLPINVKPVTRPTISGNNELCIYDTDTYTTATGMTNYVWSVIGGTFESPQGNNQMDVKWNVSGTGKLVVRYYNNLECPAIMVDTFKVTVHPLPEPTITGTRDTCYKQCAIYSTETGMSNYQWIANNGTIDGNDNFESVKVCWNKVFDPAKGFLKVIYTDLNNCRAAGNDSVGITVYKLPATPVISGDTTPCIYSEKTYTFVNQNGFTVDEYIWTVTGADTIDGGDKSDNFIKVRWKQNGIQEINLMITTIEGCKPDLVGKLKVNVQPRVYANFIADTVCFGNATQFTDLSKVGSANATESNAKEWNWYFENEISPFATTQNPSFAFPAGEHNIKLVVTSKYDCLGDTILKIRVDTLPVPSITGSSAECFDECTVYRTEKGMSNYVWTVTNGTIKDGISNLDSVIICWDVLSGANLGKVSVSYTNGKGCTSATPTEKDNITVYELPATPVILGDDEVCFNSELTYKYQPQAGFTVSKYVWTVTTGTIIAGGNTANGGNGCDSIKVRWTDAGAQTITLAITDANGCKPYNTGSLSVTVEGEVKADFSFNTVCFNNPTQFTNLSKIGTANSESSNTRKWYWYQNLSTVPFDSVQHPSKVLNLGDSVRLRVISNFGCLDEITKKITIDTLPVPSITGSSAECFKQCTVYKTEKGMSDYVWTVTHGTIKDGINNRDSVTICWDDVYGSFIGEVGINYKDGNGCTASSPIIKDNITIFKLPSNLVILGDEAPCYNMDALYKFEHQATFTATQFSWAISAGEIISGGTDTDSIRVKWPGFGKYEIILGIMDHLGCMPDSLARKKIEVKGEYPVINGEDWACLGIPGNFYETKADMTNYNWYIEGGTIVAGSTSNKIDVRWDIPGYRKLAVAYLDPDINCTLFMIDTFNVYVIPCQISDCAPLTDKFVVEDSVGKGFYTHQDTTWDLQPLAGFSFDSVRYIINGNIYDSGIGASLLNAKFPVRKTSTVIAVGYFYGIPDTCEFTVKVIMACPDTVKDIENHIYDVTSHVGLCWTTNLMTTTYADGSPITFANPYSCQGCPNPSEMGEIFGLLYTWYSTLGVTEGDNNAMPATTQGICPNGWRLPTLYEYLLLNEYPLEELKSTQYWIVPGNNYTGFNSLPAGMYSGATGKFIDMYGFTAYWSSDSEANIYAFYYSINYFCDVGISIKSSKTDAFSVRCVLDFDE